MNEKVRAYLIDVARQKAKFVYYSELVTACQLRIDLKTNSGRAQLTQILSEVSEFEYLNGRPMISSIAIYKNDKLNDHGEGFYILAEKLLSVDRKRLRKELYAFVEAQKCRDFWQRPDNYNKFKSSRDKSPTGSNLNALYKKLLNKSEYAWTAEWAKDYYEFVLEIQSLQQALKSNLTLAIDDERLYTTLSPSVSTYELFMARWLKQHRNGISSRGQSILSMKDHQAIIKNKTFKIIAKEVILQPTQDNYNVFMDWWYRNDEINNRPLLVNRAFAACNPTEISCVVDFRKFWNLVGVLQNSFGFKFSGDPVNNWYSANQQVTAWVDKQIDISTTMSNSILQTVIWRNIFLWLVFTEFNSDQAIAPNTLIETDIPTDGPTDFQDSARTFKGIDVDFEQKARVQKDLGDAGEELVVKIEQEYLQKIKQHEKAKLVRIVKDGMGYDVLSFDEHGKEKFIEVKTTTGGRDSPFYLTINELEFMRSKQNMYQLYRLFDYDEEYNSAHYFKIVGDVERQLLLKCQTYTAIVKGISTNK